MVERMVEEENKSIAHVNALVDATIYSGVLALYAVVAPRLFEIPKANDPSAGVFIMGGVITAFIGGSIVGGRTRGYKHLLRDYYDNPENTDALLNSLNY